MGVLRPDSENVDWTASGEQLTYKAAGQHAHEALSQLIVREDQRQEYRVEVGHVPVIVWPGIDPAGVLEVPELAELLPSEYELTRLRLPWVRD